MAFQLPRLPFSPDALSPLISRETIEFHFGKHHKAYVDKTNELNKNGAETLEELVRTASGPLFNNAAQAWNHAFYWHCLLPGGSRPSGALERDIDATFGGVDGFLEKFTASAADNFGSGWTWLVRGERGGLAIQNTTNAENPIRQGSVPLLVVDVWEHAYYIDYRNDRRKHLAAVKNVLNWRFASERFEADEIFSATNEMHERSAA
jgi:Fe-Mn family superoxide dismutase